MAEAINVGDPDHRGRRIPLWRGARVHVRQLAEDFARYLYLPRPIGPGMLTASVQDGAGLLLWQQEGIADADSYDQAAGRYRGLRCGDRLVPVAQDELVVKRDVATRQAEADRAPRLMRASIANAAVAHAYPWHNLGTQGAIAGII